MVSCLKFWCFALSHFQKKTRFSWTSVQQDWVRQMCFFCRTNWSKVVLRFLLRLSDFPINKWLSGIFCRKGLNSSNVCFCRKSEQRLAQVSRQRHNSRKIEILALAVQNLLLKILLKIACLNFASSLNRMRSIGFGWNFLHRHRHLQ